MRCPEWGTATCRDVTEDLYPKWHCPKCHFEWNESGPETMYDSLVRQGTYYKDAYKRAYGWHKKAPKSIPLSTPETVFKWPDPGWLTYDFDRRYTPLKLRVTFALVILIAALLLSAICVCIWGLKIGEDIGALLVFLIIIEIWAVVPWAYTRYNDMSRFLQEIALSQMLSRNYVLHRIIRVRREDDPLYIGDRDISNQSEETVFFKVLSREENAVASMLGRKISKHPEFDCYTYFEKCATCLPYRPVDC